MTPRRLFRTLAASILLIAVASPVLARTIFIAGDSTASEYAAERYPRMGWGQVLGDFYGDDILVVDLAQSGRSARSFIDEGYFALIEERIGPGDILLIQFGHNDQKENSPERYADPDTDYPAFLARYVEMARENGATPVLLTPVVRRKFVDGQRVPTHGAYPDSVRALAAQDDVGLIDMTDLSGRFIDGLGDEGSRAIYLHYVGPEGPVADDTHFSERGAYAMAALVARQLDALHLVDCRPPPAADAAQTFTNAAGYAEELTRLKTYAAFAETEGIDR